MRERRLYAPDDGDIRFTDLIEGFKAERNHGEVLFIVSCLREVAGEDIFHFIIIGTHWFYEVKDDQVCASGTGPRQGSGTGLDIYVRHARAVGSPAGWVRLFYSPTYRKDQIETFVKAIQAIKEPRRDYPVPEPPVAPPAEPEQKKEMWHYLE